MITTTEEAHDAAWRAWPRPALTAPAPLDAGGLTQSVRCVVYHRDAAGEHEAYGVLAANPLRSIFEPLFVPIWTRDPHLAGRVLADAIKALPELRTQVRAEAEVDTLKQRAAVLEITIPLPPIAAPELVRWCAIVRADLAHAETLHPVTLARTASPPAPATLDALRAKFSAGKPMRGRRR